MGMAARRVVAGLLFLSGLLTLGYLGVSSYIAEELVYEAPKPIVNTPAEAFTTFMASGMDTLVLGDHVVDKRAVTG